MDWLRELRSLPSLRLVWGSAIIAVTLLMLGLGKPVPDTLVFAFGAAVGMLFPSSSQGHRS